MIDVNMKSLPFANFVKISVEDEFVFCIYMKKKMSKSGMIRNSIRIFKNCLIGIIFL